LKTLQTTLNLNPSQVTSIRQLAQSRRESLRSIREQSRPKFEQLMSMLRQPNPDPAAVGRIVIELKGIHEQARTKQTDFDNQLSSILNPEQRRTVDNLRNQAPTFIALRSLGLLGNPDLPGRTVMRESDLNRKNRYDRSRNSTGAIFVRPFYGGRSGGADRISECVAARRYCFASPRDHRFPARAGGIEASGNARRRTEEK